VNQTRPFVGWIGGQCDIAVGFQAVDQDLDVLAGEGANAGYSRDGLGSQPFENLQNAPPSCRGIFLPMNVNRGLPQLIGQGSRFRK
jgi:hypothetical protein